MTKQELELENKRLKHTLRRIDDLLYDSHKLTERELFQNIGEIKFYINQHLELQAKEENENEKTERRVSVEVHGKLENVPLLEEKKLLKMKVKYIETDDFSGYDIYENDKGEKTMLKQQ